MNLKTKKDLHLLRKFWHTLTGVCALALTYFMGWNSKEAGIVAGCIGLVVLVIELIRIRNEKVNRSFFKIAKPFLREHEAKKVSALPYYALGVSISFLLFNWDIAILSILYLVFADPIAALVGTLLPLRKITQNKSLGGSLTFGIVCFVVNSFYYQFTQAQILESSLFFLVSPICGVLSEFFVIKDDNLSIPVISGALMSGIFYFL